MKLQTLWHYAITWVSSEISDWEDNFRVNFSDAIGSTDSSWIQSKHDVEILSNYNKATKIAYFASAVHANCLRTACKLLFSKVYGTRDFQHSIRKAATKRWRLTISTNVRRPCKLLANCEFALHGIRDFQPHSIRTAARKSRTTIHDRPCELLVNCEFALRGSDSFRSSEPKETNAQNACNVKWPVYTVPAPAQSTLTATARLRRRYNFLKIHPLLKFWHQQRRMVVVKKWFDFK